MRWHRIWSWTLIPSINGALASKVKLQSYIKALIQHSHRNWIWMYLQRLYCCIDTEIELECLRQVSKLASRSQLKLNIYTKGLLLLWYRSWRSMPTQRFYDCIDVEVEDECLYRNPNVALAPKLNPNIYNIAVASKSKKIVPSDCPPNPARPSSMASQ